MNNALSRAFTAHPATVGETYGEHSAFAVRMGFKLLAAGAAALVHAVLPFAFETTASRAVKEMNEIIVKRQTAR